MDRASRQSALLAATMSSFLTPFMSSSINTALPSIGRELALDAVSLSWVSTAYLLASAIFLVPFGRLADIHGRKRIFSLGMVLHTVSSLLLTFSNSSASLILLRIPQGMGSAMIFGTGVAILTSAYPPGERGKALGINSAAVYIGLSTGPFLGGLMTQALGWRTIFLLNVPLGLITIAVIMLRLKGEWAEAKGEKLDLLGSTIYGLSLTSTMLGLSQLPSMTGASLLLLGLVGTITFLQVETRSQSPVLDIQLFKDNKAFTLSNLAALMNYSATFAVSFLLSLYMQNIKGLNPPSAGLVLMAQPLVQAGFSPLAGKLSDRREPRIIASTGMAITSTALLLLALVMPTGSLELIIGSLALLGFGLALFASPNMNAVMTSVEKRLYGVASATLATMRVTGQMISMGVTTVVLAAYVGRVQVTEQYHALFVQGLTVSLIVFASLCFIGIFTSLSKGKIRQTDSLQRLKELRE